LPPAGSQSLDGDFRRSVGVVYGIGASVPAHERSLAWRYRGQVAAELEIAPISSEEFEQLLPLIAAYQRFYEVES
jgi:HPt (histidine-containing phosphotransfer) domain-containing protein